MRDPFRPNSNSQVMREAQFAFVVIVLLLGVLVYVAIHRVSGRKFRFRQIAQTAPVAQHIGENAYPAQTILDHEERISQDAPSTTQCIARPEPNKRHQTSPTAKPASTQTFSPRQQPSAPAIQTQPVAPAFSAAAAPAPSAPSIAQAQFIELPKTKPALNPAPKRHRAISKPAVDDPFEKINGPSPTSVRSLASVHGDKEKDPVPQDPASNDAASDDSTAGFHPPPIRSDFGAGSTRELPSFDAPKKEEPVEKTATLIPTPTPLSPAPKSTQPQVNAFVPTQNFVPPQKTASSLAQPSLAQSFNTQETAEAKVVKKQIPKAQPKPLGQQEYRVKTTDSLWSIALDHYGDGRFFRALHKHNLDRINSADRLEPNTTLVIPEVDELIERYAELCPADKLGAGSLSIDDDRENSLPEADYDLYEKSMDKRFHVTQSGDTLFDVARQRLGQASRYLEIFELNRFRIPQHANHLTPLHPGLRLLLPE